jgi:hypothetical protein
LHFYLIDRWRVSSGNSHNIFQRLKQLIIQPYAREVKEIGYEGWRDKYRYGQRWMTEAFFSGVKRTFGETTRAKSIEGMFQEVEMKFSFYDAFISW